MISRSSAPDKLYATPAKDDKPVTSGKERFFFGYEAAQAEYSMDNLSTMSDPSSLGEVKVPEEGMQSMSEQQSKLKKLQKDLDEAGRLVVAMSKEIKRQTPELARLQHTETDNLELQEHLQSMLANPHTIFDAARLEMQQLVTRSEQSGNNMCMIHARMCTHTHAQTRKSTHTPS